MRTNRLTKYNKTLFFYVHLQGTHNHSCPSTNPMSVSNRALSMSDKDDGDAVSRCQVLSRAGSVHHGANRVDVAWSTLFWLV